MESKNNQNQKSSKTTLFERLISPALQYVGMVGAIMMAVAYVALVVVLINGLNQHTLASDAMFAGVNAGVGFVIMQFLKIQGVSFAKNLPENKAILEEYYNTKTKDKRSRSITFFWVTTTIKDFFFKCITLGLTTLGIVYIIIEGSHDWALLLLAFVNLIMFACFGILSLNHAYEFFNTRHIPYIKEQLEKGKDNEQ